MGYIRFGVSNLYLCNWCKRVNMAEFFKKNEEERKKENEWLYQFKPNFESTLAKIEKHQERKLFSLEIIALVLIGAFLVNLLSTSLFDLTLSGTYIENGRAILDIILSSVSLISIIGVFIFFKKQLLKYKPRTPVLTLIVKPEDIKPFIAKKRFELIMQFLDDAKLTNFKKFSNGFFESFKVDFGYIFGKAVDKPIKEYEEKSEDPLHNDLVKMTKDYDLSDMSTTGVKVTLKVQLIPRVVHSYTQEGDKTASYSFYLTFHLIILNPEHCNSGEIVEYYYVSKASEIVKFASYSIDKAFKKNGLPFAKEQFIE